MSPFYINVTILQMTKQQLRKAEQHSGPELSNRIGTQIQVSCFQSQCLPLFSQSLILPLQKPAFHNSLLGMVVQAYKPSTWKVDQEDQIKVSLS